jgi:hypothetical protein
MLSLLVSSLALQAGRPGATALMKLRGGGMPSAEQAQTTIGWLLMLPAIAGNTWTKENLEMYEFTSPLEEPTIAFGKFNYAVQIAHGLMLLGKFDAVTALAVAMYASTPVQDMLKCPKLPVLAWAGSLLLLNKLGAEGKVAKWILPAVLIASGLQGTFMFDLQKSMYGVSVPLTAQSEAMGKFFNGAFTTLGVYMLGPVLGWSSAQSFGAYALTYVAYIFKMAFVDGVGLFNPVGAYVWAGLFAAAGVTALTA